MKLMNENVSPAYLRNLEYHFYDYFLISFFDYLRQFIKTFVRKGKKINLKLATNYKKKNSME